MDISNTPKVKFEVFAPLRAEPAEPGCNRYRARNLQTGRLAICDSFVCNFRFAPQKVQGQEDQLENQLKQKYMRIVSSSHLVIPLPSTEASALVFLSEMSAGTGSKEKKCHQVNRSSSTQPPQP